MLQTTLFLLGVFVFAGSLWLQLRWVEDLGTALSFALTQAIYFGLGAAALKVFVFPATNPIGSLGGEFTVFLYIATGLFAIWLACLFVGLILGFVRARRDYS